MSFVSFQIELQKTNELLGRIAIALERIAGPEQSHQHRQRQASEIVNYAERTWEREQILRELQPMGLAPEVEQQVLDALEDEANKSQ